jgi:hypothetical protein
VLCSRIALVTKKCADAGGRFKIRSSDYEKEKHRTPDGVRNLLALDVYKHGTPPGVR